MRRQAHSSFRGPYRESPERLSRYAANIFMEAPIYNTQGKKTGTIELPESVFNVPWNDSLMHQVVTSMQANARTPVAHTKFRGDVRGGGKKPWRQKGTGRARHGSLRSPIWRGGGVVHGPTNERDYSKKINKKMRRKALQAVLAKKIADNEIVVFDNMTFKEIKTKEAASFLKKLENASLMKPRKTKTVLLEKPRGNVALSFRNIPSIKVLDARNFNTLDALESKYVLLTEKLFHGLV